MKFTSLLLASVFTGGLGLVLGSTTTASSSIPEEAWGGDVEEFKFETQVNKVMDIIIHSLYKTKEVFLRELLSNAADALGKIRFASLTDANVLDSNPDLKIYIKSSKDERVITIRDTGIGMTKESLIKNLGTVAKSGTADFLKNIENQNMSDPGLIGQFGVGFYSAFLVADRVQVVSKHNSDDQYIWESDSQNNFKVAKDPRGNTLGRGTEIILHLRDDSANFLDFKKLDEVVRKHSEFINFPIYLWSETVIEEVDDEVAPASEDEGSEVEDVEEDAPKIPTPPVTKTGWDWHLVNEIKPIWTRPPSDISTDEYNGFFRAHFKQTKDPLAYSHFKLEGDHRFTAMIFVPAEAPYKFLQPDSPPTNSLQLFVRRVFITDELNDILPKWLTFIKVLIDSDDLPLNVNRETLQSHASLKIIRNRIVSKALDLLLELAENESDVYDKIYDKYASALRYGLVDAKSKHKDKLQRLLRFETSLANLVSLEEYTKNMKEGQPQIYFAAGSNFDEIKSSPLAEKVIKRGYEVLLIADPLEEYVIQEVVTTFGNFSLQNVAKDGLLFGDESEEKEEAEKTIKEKFEPLRLWLAEELYNVVETVRISSRLSSAPCVIVPGKVGGSPSQERAILAQAGGKINPSMKYYLEAKRVMEINPRHPIMEKLLTSVESKATESIAHVPEFLYEVYSVASGYDARQPSIFAERVERVLRTFVGVDLESEAEDHIEPAPKPVQVTEEESKKRMKESAERKKRKDAEAEAQLRADSQKKVQEAADAADAAAGIKKKKPKFDMEEIQRKIREHDEKVAREAEEASQAASTGTAEEKNDEL